MSLFVWPIINYSVVVKYMTRFFYIASAILPQLEPQFGYHHWLCGGFHVASEKKDAVFFSGANSLGRNSLRQSTKYATLNKTQSLHVIVILKTKENFIKYHFLNL